MRVMIVDDHEVVRDGLALLMKDAFPVDGFMFASDGREAVQQATNHDVDLVLLDLSMPEGMDGIQTLIQLRKLLPSARIVIFSMYDDIGYQKRAYEYGADGYLVKRIKSDELIQSLDLIMAGNKVFDQMTIQHGQNSLDRTSWDLPITPREREVFILTVMGHTQKEIADKLSIAVKTVENHRQNISKKLGSKKRSDWLEIAQKYHVFDMN